MMLIWVGVASNPRLWSHLLFVSGSAPTTAQAVMVVLELAFIVLGILIMRGQLPLPMHVAKALFSLFSFAGGLYGLIYADRACGRWWKHPQDESGLVFPPRTELVYDAAEFNVVARINSLGFRDAEYPVDKGDRFRVLAIGDSYTYGWGVNVEDSWCKLLERELQTTHPRCEVLNLGKGGSYPTRCAEVARKAVPLLKPDLVLVAILQGDDLFQTIDLLRQQTAPSEAAGGDWNRAGIQRRKLRFQPERLFPNLLSLLPRPARSRVSSAWRTQAWEIYARLTAEQLKQLEALEPAVRSDFWNGKLNPSLVWNWLRRPDCFSSLEDTNRAEVKQGIAKMAAALKEIKALVEPHGGEVIVLAVPGAVYACPESVEVRGFGVIISETMRTSGAADFAITEAAAQAGVAAFTFLGPFQAACATAPLYYKYDTHFTKAGNRLFAGLVARTVGERVAYHASTGAGSLPGER